MGSIESVKNFGATSNFVDTNMGITDGITMANVKTAISVPEKLFKEIERYAKRAKVSRSAVFVAAVQQMLSRRAADEITRRLNEHYDKYPMTEEDMAWSRASAAQMWEFLKDDKW